MNESAEFTIGVEEEYQIINPETRELCGKADKIIRDARQTLDEDVVQPEMYRSQIEIATPREAGLVRSKVSKLPL